MTGYAPPGWPEAVRPPGTPDWEATATAFLLDCCPPDFRGYPVLRRHPVVLARVARESVAGQQAAARTGLAGIRSGLAGLVPPEVVQQAVEVWLTEQARLARTERAVGLVAEAIDGRVFVPRL